MHSCGLKNILYQVWTHLSRDQNVSINTTFESNVVPHPSTPMSYKIKTLVTNW